MPESKKELLRSIKFLLFSISAGVIQIGSYSLFLELLKWDGQFHRLFVQHIPYLFEHPPRLLIWVDSHPATEQIPAPAERPVLRLIFQSIGKYPVPQPVQVEMP